MKSIAYCRTISYEEARDGYFMVLKDQLSFFPISGTAFEVLNGGLSAMVTVESYACECRGPDKPHRHYFVRWKGLRAGDRITLRSSGRKAGRYIMQIRSAVAQREFCG